MWPILTKEASFAETEKAGRRRPKTGCAPHLFYTASIVREIGEKGRGRGRGREVLSKSSPKRFKAVAVSIEYERVESS